MAVSTAIDEERLETLAASFSGTLLRPEDDGYDETRKIHNALIDKRPALIALPEHRRRRRRRQPRAGGGPGDLRPRRPAARSQRLG
jgi:hypothetical protein